MTESKGVGRSPETLAGAATALYRKMSPHRRRHLALVLLLTLIGAAAELLTIGAVLPFLALIADAASVARIPAFQGMVNLLSWGGDGNLIVPATILLITAALFTAGMRLIIAWVTQQFAAKLGHEIGVEIFHRMLHQPYSYFLTRNSSETIAGVEKVHSVVNGVLLPSLLAITAIIIAAFIVAFLLIIDPFTASIAAATVAGTYLLASYMSRRMLERNSVKIATSLTARVKALQEGLGGIRDILLEQSQPVFEDAFKVLDLRFRRAQAVNAFVSQAPRFVVEATGITVLALLALYMSFQPGGIAAAIPTLGALAVGASRLLPLLQQAYFGWSQASGSLRVLYDVIALANTPVLTTRRRDRSRRAPEFRRDIVLEGVCFRYLSDRYALADVNLNVPKGARVGVMGETGSGKSTLLDLIMGLLDPSEGEIRIDGTPLNEESRGDWQSQIAHVPQSIYLSDSSIASNIAFGEPADAIDFDRVRDAARRAQIDDFVLSLPEGFATEVGERGVRLSGGQRQRIGIARALYKRTPVLVLDEATSALDDATEASIMTSIDALGSELTIFIIAHRLSTLAGCDVVVELACGRIARAGPAEAMIGGRTLPQHAR